MSSAEGEELLSDAVAIWLCGVLGACDQVLRERIVVAALLATASLAVYAASYLPHLGAIQRLARRVRDVMTVLLVCVSLFGTGALIVLTMIVFLPLHRLHPPAWYYVANSIWCVMWAISVLYVEVFGGLQVVLYGEVPLPGEMLLITPNHLSDLDWVVVLGLAARCDALAGLRFIMKASLAKLPVLGWGLALHHSVFIRSRPEGRAMSISPSERALTVSRDTETIASTVRSLTTRHGCGQCCWIVLYAEGTRLTPEQHKRALDYAREHGKASYKYLLQPRVKGLSAVLHGARQRITHTLDLTVAYEGFAAECERNVRPAGLMDGVIRDTRVHVLIRRVALPGQSEDAQAWLHALWAEKERALARWEHDGSFEAERIELPLPARPLLGALVAYAVCAALCASGAVLACIEVYHIAVDMSSVAEVR